MIVGLHHTFMYFLNLVIDAKDFTLKRSSFHIFRPKAIKLLSPYFEDLRCLTRMTKGLTLESLLGLNMFFMKLGLILLIVLKISKGKLRSLLIFIVVVFLFFNKIG